MITEMIKEVIILNIFFLLMIRIIVEKITILNNRIEIKIESLINVE